MAGIAIKRDPKGRGFTPIKGIRSRIGPRFSDDKESELEKKMKPKKQKKGQLEQFFAL